MNPADVGKKVKSTWGDGVASDGRAYKDIPDVELGAKYLLKNGDQGLKALGLDPDTIKAQQKQKTDSQEIKSDLATKAQEVIRVLDAGKSGKLKGQAYTDALYSASSAYAASKGFEQGGKALTGPELTILGGQLPVMQQHGQSFIDKLTGYMPPQRGEVTDKPDTLRRKMQIALDVAQGKKVNLEQLGQGEEQQPQGNFIQNAPGDVGNIINSLLGAPRAAIDQGLAAGKQASQAPNFFAGNQATQQLLPQNMILEMLKGYGGNLLKDVGNPEQGGDVAGRALDNFNQRPVSTALDALPFLSGAKAKFATGGDTAEAVTSGKGAGMRARARNIDVGPQIGGPQREAQINKTFDAVGLKGNPEQQYAQIKPKMEEISGHITKALKDNPQTVPISEVKNAFMGNLEEQLTTKQLNAKTANIEVKGYLSDLYKASFDTKMPNDISTEDLFSLKKKVNQQYKGVKKKIDAGNPLLDREKVISAARKTLDDIIADKNPEVKDLTLMQTDLFDGYESLYKRARQQKMGIRLPFLQRVPLPSNTIRGGEDMIGRILQGKKQ